jgi:hypothetical protein
MAAITIDMVIERLPPEVLADRTLGDGGSFTPLHLRHPWPLTCLHAGQYYEESEVGDRVRHLLPANVLLAGEVSA